MTTSVPDLLFDGSWKGLLTAIFEVFERKWFNAGIFVEDDYQATMFDDRFRVVTDNEKAKRVYDGLRKRLDAASFKTFFYAFFSEQPVCYQYLLDMAVYVFRSREKVADNFGHPAVLGVSQFAKSVGREAHRMKAFIRFQKLSDGTFFEAVHPDFNVLPLVASHFKKRYTDQPWIIYDEKRKFGLYYDKTVIQEITFHFWERKKDTDVVVQRFDANEMKYDQLWKDYYKSATIASRKNEASRRRHVPLRYRKYLNEFDSGIE